MPFISPEQKRATDFLVSSIIQAKSKWMESIMSQVLPKDVYDLSKSGKNRDRMKLSRWMARNSFLIKEGDGFSQIWIGEVLISEWRFRLDGVKVEQTISKPNSGLLECFKEILSLEGFPETNFQSP